MIWTLLQVAAGGAIGAMGRYLTGILAMRLFGVGFPFGTLSVNVVGSFLMGIAFVFLMTRSEEVSRMVPFVMTGILGGFTTFSAFSLDFWTLLDKDRWAAALVYLSGSVVLSVLALVVGIFVARGAAG